MIIKKDEPIYNYYTDYIKRLFLEGRSFFEDDKDEVIFTKNNIDECSKRFIDNYDNSSEGFDTKLAKQFEGASDAEKELFSHAIWLWGFSVNQTNKSALVFCDTKKRVDAGFANPGMYHVISKYQEISFIIRLFNDIFSLKEKKADLTTDEIKEFIVELCLSYKYKDDYPLFNQYKDYEVVSKDLGKRPMVDILLYLSKPERYEPIVSYSHKERIAAYFSELLDDGDDESLLDDKIYKIREKITDHINRDFDFYDENLRVLWDISSQNENGTDEFSALDFKRNIVFYGPPGTGKTYSAKKLAKSFVVRKRLLSGKTKLSDYLAGKDNSIIEKAIRIHQLHSNYTYDSFIVGQTISQGDIKVKKGVFYELCEEAKKDPESPFVLILDELNRVDLARLFGEAFSGIENRGDPIELPYLDDATNKPLVLEVPDNLYIIGTMNEIDFSLERLDFALRRRFLWFRHGFDADYLREMIVDLPSDFQNDYIELAIAVNNEIRNTPELGEEYEIGHAFFSEITKLYQSIKKTGGNQQRRTIYNKSKKALWYISIKPIIESYLDNINLDRKNEILNKIEKEIWQPK